MCFRKLITEVKVKWLNSYLNTYGEVVSQKCTIAVSCCQKVLFLVSFILCEIFFLFFFTLTKQPTSHPCPLACKKLLSSAKARFARVCLRAGHSSHQCKHATNLIIIHSDRKVFAVEQRVSVWQGDGRRICIFASRLCAREQEPLCNGDGRGEVWGKSSLLRPVAQVDPQGPVETEWEQHLNVKVVVYTVAKYLWHCTFFFQLKGLHPLDSLWQVNIKCLLNTTYVCSYVVNQGQFWNTSPKVTAEFSIIK